MQTYSYKPAWTPYGFPLYYVLRSVGAALCPPCARSVDAVAPRVNVEDHNLYCERCGARVDPAFKEV